MKIIKKLVYFVTFAAIFAACYEPMDEITDVDYSRAFSPIGLKTEEASFNAVTIVWETIDDANSYIVELSQGDSLVFDNIVETVETEVTTLRLTGLDRETRYSVRVKSKAFNDGQEDSKWYGIVFKTPAEQIMALPANVKTTKATLVWTANEEVSHLLVSASGLEDVTIALTADEIAAGAKTLTGLTPSTTYTVAIYNGDLRRGKQTFTTASIPAGAIQIPLGAALTDYLTEGAILFLPEGYSYTAESAILLPGNIQIYGDPDADVMPVINASETGGGKALFTLATAVKVSFVNVGFGHTTPDANGCSIIDQQTKGATTIVDSLVFDNCKVSGFGRALVRLRASAEADLQTVSNLIINNCVMDNLSFDGSNGYFLGDNTYGQIVHAAITNSTLSNVGSATGGAHTFNVSKVGTNFDISNCTFYNVIGGNGTERFLITSKSGYTAAISNSIFGKTNGNESVYSHELSATDEAGLTGNGNFKTTDWLAGTASGGTTVSLLIPQMTSTGGSAADLFEDPANGNFTLKASVPSAVKSAGDPRWW